MAFVCRSAMARARQDVVTLLEREAYRRSRAEIRAGMAPLLAAAIVRARQKKANREACETRRDKAPREKGITDNEVNRLLAAARGGK